MPEIPSKKSRGEIGYDFLKLSLAFLISAGSLVYLLPLVLSPEVDEGTKKWMTGAIGMILGFWVK